MTSSEKPDHNEPPAASLAHGPAKVEDIERVRRDVEEAGRRVHAGAGSGTTVSQPDRAALLRSMYAAFNARDVDTCLAAMTSDVDWANGWEGGRVAGRDAVRDYWRRQWAELDTSAEPLGITERPDGAIEVAVRLVARDLAGNLVSQGEGVHVYEFRGDLVERMTIAE